MQFKTILRLLGILLMMFSFSMLTPLLINLFFSENVWIPFLSSFGLTFFTGLSLALGFKNARKELKIRDGFLIVVLFWVVLSLFASLPFIMTIDFEQGITDAVFEAVSGLTTTGASVIARLNDLPASLLFYRQQLQFFGGMGIVVLAVAILPMLGVGGMQLYQNETPGPMKENKLTPRIAQTAKALWSIYLLLTLLCMLGYWLLGMSWFDAIGESFATVSTGGFSMHEQNFAFYHSSSIELLAVLFMILGGTNFSLHFIAVKKGSLKHYWQDDEFRFYILSLMIVSAIVALSLMGYGYFVDDRVWIIFEKSFFNVISMATTTGFLATPFDSWPAYVTVLMLLLAIIGGSAGSTSGGVKSMRALLLFKQSKREMNRLLHPHAVMPIKFAHRSLPEQVLQSMWGFISLFIALFLLLWVLLIAFGNDFITSFSAVVATLANAGAGVGNISASFIHLNIHSKWLLIFAMLAGRLEIFSLLILFSRQFWQK